MDTIANGARIHYIEAGEGPAVVCMHGLGLNTDVFRNQMPVLSQRYRMIAYDLRGMGKSEAPGCRGMTHTIELHARDLSRFLDALGIEAAAIVAHAYGAIVSMQFAMTNPERVNAMVIVNTTANLGEPGISQALFRAAVAELDGMTPLLDVAMSRWFLGWVHRERPEVIQFYRQMLSSTPPMGYAASARSLAQVDLLDGLGRIGCQTLVVAGDQDGSTPPLHHKEIAERIPGARFVIIENASHTVPEEQPEEFNQITLDFLNQVLERSE